jgi:hypothetical protein
MTDKASPTAEGSKWERREISLGIGAFVFFVVGVALDGPVMISSMTGQEVVAHFKDNQSQMFAAFVAIGISVFCLLWFLGAMRSRLRQGGVGAERLASTFFGAGVAFAALLLVGRAAAGAPSAIYGFGSKGAELDPVTASLFRYFAYDLWALAGIAASVCVAALSVAGKMTGELPRWLVRTGYAAAVVAFVSVAFPYATLALVMLWLGAVSWSGLRRHSKVVDASSIPVRPVG